MKQVGFERYIAAEPAFRAWVALQARLVHPSGTFDKAGRWYPDAEETQPCCSAIRGPSRAWPYSYLVHCRSINHVAARFGVEPKLLRGLIAYTSWAKRPTLGAGVEFCADCGASWACEHRQPEAAATMREIEPERADMRRHLGQ